MNANEFFADVLMLVHAGFSFLVVGGLFAILIGMILGWHWMVKVRWFRILHLMATMFLVVRVWAGVPCPFSVAESFLRGRTTTPCPLGVAFHDFFHVCAFRETNPHYFIVCVTLIGILTLGAFSLSGGGRATQPTTAT